MQNIRHRHEILKPNVINEPIEGEIEPQPATQTDNSYLTKTSEGPILIDRV